MARPREPADLVKAKGKSHLSKKEYEEKKAQEIEVPFKNVKAPEYLKGTKQRKKFKEYAEKLLAIGIFTELDVDCLARYVIAETLYVEYSTSIQEVLKTGEFEVLNKLQLLQDKAFKQCQSCARDLGLTITSRCRITIPPPAENEDDEL